jgi:hypothetical protein
MLGACAFFFPCLPLRLVRLSNGIRRRLFVSAMLISTLYAAKNLPEGASATHK